MANISFNKICKISRSPNFKLKANPIHLKSKQSLNSDFFEKSKAVINVEIEGFINIRNFLEELKNKIGSDFFNPVQKEKSSYDYSFLDEIAVTLDNYFTKFDNPKIVKAREELAEVKPTHLINTPERNLLRKNIAEKLYATGATKKEKQVYLIMGPPTSGKSTALCEPIATKKGAMIIDPDIAKEYIPEYGGGKFAGAVHEESWLITHDVIEKATSNSDNVVLALVGSNANEVLNICNKFDLANYKIHLSLVDVSPEVAAQRSVLRYDKTGRFVDPYYIYNEVGNRPKENFHKLLKARDFNSYAHFSNEVPRGESPKIIEKSNNFSDVLD